MIHCSMHQHGRIDVSEFVNRKIKHGLVDRSSVLQELAVVHILQSMNVDEFGMLFQHLVCEFMIHRVWKLPIGIWI